MFNKLQFSINEIYPYCLQMKKAFYISLGVNLLDVDLFISRDILYIKLFDKRELFKFQFSIHATVVFKIT